MDYLQYCKSNQHYLEIECPPPQENRHFRISFPSQTTDRFFRSASLFVSKPMSSWALSSEHNAEELKGAFAATTMCVEVPEPCVDGFALTPAMPVGRVGETPP